MRLKKWNSRVFAFSLALAAVQSFGAVYYVATDGSDNNAGTKAKPFASLNKANKVVHAGDTVWVRGGIYDLHDTVFFERYRMTAAIVLTASGESDDNRIHYLAYPGERPIFDGANFQVYNVNDGDLVACFANDIPEAAIRQIAAAKPLRAVFRDSSFKSDSAKINVTEIFKTISPNTTVKVV